jgi:hypothetical protein
MPSHLIVAFTYQLKSAAFWKAAPFKKSDPMTGILLVAGAARLRARVAGLRACAALRAQIRRLHIVDHVRRRL